MSEKDQHAEEVTEIGYQVTCYPKEKASALEQIKTEAERLVLLTNVGREGNCLRQGDSLSLVCFVH